MAETDKAVIIGINDYQHMPGKSLAGPVNDALCFYDWVRSPAGGSVPEKNVFLFLSKNDRLPSQEPTSTLIENTMIDNILAGSGGRRLYIFASGHGICGANLEPLLITCDSRSSPIRNLKTYPVRKPAEYCFNADLYQEIILFMDFCQIIDDGIYPSWGVTMPLPTGNTSQRRRFYVAAVTEGRAAKEIRVDGIPRGLFSTVLMDGLAGFAGTELMGPPEHQYVSSNNLMNYLAFAVPRRVSENKVVLSDPDLLIPNSTTNDGIQKLALCDNPKLGQVEFILKDPAQISGLRIYESRGRLLKKLRVPEDPRTLALPNGAYRVTATLLDGSESVGTKFEIYGSEPTHAEL